MSSISHTSPTYLPAEDNSGHLLHDRDPLENSLAEVQSQHRRRQAYLLAPILSTESVSRNTIESFYVEMLIYIEGMTSCCEVVTFCDKFRGKGNRTIPHSVYRISAECVQQLHLLPGIYQAFATIPSVVCILVGISVERTISAVGKQPGRAGGLCNDTYICFGLLTDLLLSLHESDLETARNETQLLSFDIT